MAFNIILMRFQAAALLAALALVPACAKRLNSFAFVGAAVIAIVSGGKGGIGESRDHGGGGTGSGGGGDGGGRHVTSV